VVKEFEKIASAYAWRAVELERKARPGKP